MFAWESCAVSSQPRYFFNKIFDMNSLSLYSFLFKQWVHKSKGESQKYLCPEYIFSPFLKKSAGLLSSILLSFSDFWVQNKPTHNWRALCFLRAADRMFGNMIIKMFSSSLSRCMFSECKGDADSNFYTRIRNIIKAITYGVIGAKQL